MGIKKFIKISLTKIILSIFLFILFGYINIVPCLTFGIIPNPTYNRSFCPLNPLPLIGIIGAGYSYFGLIGIEGYENTIVMMIPIALLISYLLSCLIIHTFNKFRKN